MTQKDNLAVRRAKLSAAKKALLDKRLRGDTKQRTKPTPIGRRNSQMAARLSYAQQRLWFLYQLDPDSPAYNMHEAVHIKGALNVTALIRSLQEIGRRHEIWRTTFATTDSGPVQIVAARPTTNLPVLDLKPLAAAEQDSRVEALAMADIRRPFDLARGPLMRAKLLRLADDHHIFLFTVHHIISDEWSNQVFWSELGILYTAFTSGRSSPLAELPIQYADFAAWQRDWLKGEVLQSQLRYWKERLRGSPPLLQLPADRQRLAVQSFRGQLQSRLLSPTLSSKLRNLSNQSDATMFMTLLAAFKTLLHRYTGQGNIVIGTPIANRRRTEVEELQGLFLNTLVLRTYLGDNPDFLTLLERVRETSLEAYAHQDLPFEILVDELQPERDLSYNPLFQVMFVYQAVPARTVKLPGLIVTPVETRDSGAAKFDLTLFVAHKHHALQVAVEYNTDLFDAATISRLLGHFEILLQGFVANPSRRLSDLPLLTAAERNQLLIEWNSTQQDYPRETCVHQLIEDLATRQPRALAVRFGNAILSYEDLNYRANRLARHLQKLGVGPGVQVAIFMERGPELIIAIIGVLKAGAAYVPLDPCYPRQRLADMLADAQAPVALTQQKRKPELPVQDIAIICLDTGWPEIAAEPGHNPASSVTADDLAYVIYTSGSTGQPKGVQITHRNLIHSTWARLEYYSEPITSFLLLSSVAFDSSIVGIFGSLCQGGTLSLPQQGLEQDIQQIARQIARDQVSHILILPSLYKLLLTYAKPQQLDSLISVIVAGEACPPELARQHYQLLPQTNLYNEYGPTEGTVWSTVYKVPSEMIGALVPIGRPIANMQAYVLDGYRNLVPIGVPGELYIGGDGLAPGYINQPELTAAKFVQHSFNPEHNMRLYRTGDLARLLPSGNIEFLGRVDHQVKIRGYRVEPAEIELVLSDHPVIEEAVVVVREDRPGSRYLAAYLVAGGQPDDQNLRRFLKEKLPDFMIPTVFVFLPTLPRSPNGKVDHQALPPPERNKSLLTRDQDLQLSAVEQKLAKIWADVLQLESVGIHDNFFEIGGDSILSIQIIARANAAGLGLTPNQLFQYQTIADLSHQVEDKIAIDAEQGPVSGEVPLTPIQRWFFEQDHPEPDHWNQSFLMAVPPDLDFALLEQAFQHVIMYHDALRLVFVQDGSNWRQYHVEPEAGFGLKRIDLSARSAKERFAALEAVATELQSSLSLAQGMLVRGTLFKMGQGELDRLLIVIHHLVVDGVSWRILIEDLQTSYDQLTRGQTIALPPKTTSYKQWSSLLANYAQSDTAQRELKFWLNTSCHQPPTLLPLDFSNRSDNFEASARTVSVSLSAEEARQLVNKVPATYNTQMNDILIAALLQTLWQWTGGKTVLIDLEGHGREAVVEELDISRTVGWFTTIFPVRLHLDQPTSPADAIKLVKEQLRRLPRRGIGYGLLRYMSQDESVRHRLKALPQAELLFNYLGQFDQVLSGSSLFKLATESVGPLHGLGNKRRYLLEVNAYVVGERLEIKWTYGQNLYKASTIQQIAENFRQSLKALMTHCLAPDAGGYTPSDFPEANLDQKALDELIDEFSEEIE